MPNVETLVRAGRYYSSFISSDLAKLYLRSNGSPIRDTLEHVEAAVQWICAAQDAFDDGGVARSYSLVYNPYFQRKGWIPSYPETTGYIIPTMFDYARLVNRQDIFDRAIRMTDWECDIQMKNGAVQGGTVDQTATPAIFNTGQVIFGWIRAYQETKKERYLHCAEKAGAFLVEQQDHDGAWRKQLSDYASARMLSYTYNARTAWALLLLSIVLNDARIKEAAIRNIEFALSQQDENGWFRSNCLNDPFQPLLHTISYAIRGVLECGALLNNQIYIQRARKTADALIRLQRPDGSLSGRFNEQWQPTVSWSCLTGDAQISGIWSRLFQLTEDRKYSESVKRINNYLKKVQVLNTGNPGLDGGIGGSDPVHGEYGRFEILNWAVKFFVDALLLEHSIQGDMA